ncbi:hypothetical protein Dgeo_1017 [Deinococcus geothermalis DSM 11300]|uniref:Uncharacterized protein n=1 Tax=Deinococcus geothermalis (strain DSM 11300 / CIP 105573 / AG-3a) TaxID=319795 RepID=Q1IZL7_DEIGD|nr:hypothetical protein Dgeo_1017 [Deinococcus geothermalis DSM 11300]
MLTAREEAVRRPCRRWNKYSTLCFWRNDSRFLNGQHSTAPEREKQDAVGVGAFGFSLPKLRRRPQACPCRGLAKADAARLLRQPEGLVRVLRYFAPYHHR